jgi:predicted RNA-binding protein YlxR (DUF448 family)
MPKHVPLRSCVACRESKPKRELIRVVRVADDRIEIDRSGKRTVGAHISVPHKSVSRAAKTPGAQSCAGYNGFSG